MIYREADINDIKQIQIVRNSVKENILTDPGSVTDEDCKTYILDRGKGFVCLVNQQVIGFSIADLKDKNLWALFIKPEFEGKGIGSALHNYALNWYFSKTPDKIWLSTTKNTRASKFYKRKGWIEVGPYGTDEIKFELPITHFRLYIKKAGSSEPAL